MSYCPNCGTENYHGNNFCSECGISLLQNQQEDFSQSPREDVPSTGLKVLSFFVPLAGLILFCVYQKNNPESAKSYGKFALIGFVLSRIIPIIFMILFGRLSFYAGPYVYESYGIFSDVYEMCIGLMF